MYEEKKEFENLIKFSCRPHIFVYCVVDIIIRDVDWLFFINEKTW